MRKKLLVGGRGWHVGARPCAEREGRLAGMVGPIGHGSTHTSAARRAHIASARGASSRERKRVRWRYFLRTCARKLQIGGRGWHLGPRSCTEGEGRLAGAVGFQKVWTKSNQRGAARVHRKRTCCGSTRERERAQWRYSCARAQERGLLEAPAGTSERGRASRERAISQAQWAFVGRGPTPTSTVRRTHAASARAAPPPEREHVVARLRVRTRERRLLVGGRGWYVGARPCSEGEGRLAGAVSFLGAWTDFNQRGAARAHVKRACCASSGEREHAMRIRLCAHVNVGCSLEAAAGTSERDGVPRKTDVSLAQWACMGYGPTSTSAVWRSRAASARAAPYIERERAVARSRMRTRERRLLVGGRG